MVLSIGGFPTSAPTAQPRDLRDTSVVPLTRAPAWKGGTPGAIRVPQPAERILPLATNERLDAWVKNAPIANLGPEPGPNHPRTVRPYQAPLAAPAPVSQRSLDAQAARYSAMAMATPSNAFLDIVDDAVARQRNAEAGAARAAAPAPYDLDVDVTPYDLGVDVTPPGRPTDTTPTDRRPTDTRKDEKPATYPDEGAALTAELMGALAARRRTADEELQLAMERERTQTDRLNLAATTAREQTIREFRNLSEDMMRMLAGRGTARAPMVVGRGARRLQMQKDERFGQISQTLADEISALQEMVQMAERARNNEIARIAQDEALARTAPQLLLPASGAFGG